MRNNVRVVVHLSKLVGLEIYEIQSIDPVTEHWKNRDAAPSLIETVRNLGYMGYDWNEIRFYTCNHRKLIVPSTIHSMINRVRVEASH